MLSLWGNIQIAPIPKILEIAASFHHFCASIPQYVTAQKQMLGVRTQTCTDLVQLELNTGSAKSLVQEIVRDFFKKAMSNCSYSQSPLSKVAELAISAGSPAGRYLHGLLRSTDRPIEKNVEKK